MTMVAMYGMSERLGLSSCAQRQPMFLNSSESQIQRDCSEQTAREIDEEVRKLLALAYDQAKEILSTHRDELERVTAKLIEHEAWMAKHFTGFWAERSRPSALATVKCSLAIQRK